MSAQLPWFRLYHEIIDDDRLLSIAFEDRWHYVALMACKAKGILDRNQSEEQLIRALTAKLGLDRRTLDEVGRRLADVGLIELDTFQPVAWDKRQFLSDSSTERVRAHRERVKRSSNGLDTDTDNESPNGDSSRGVGAANGQKKREYSQEFEQAWNLYPKRPGMNKLETYRAWNARLNHKDPEKRATTEQMIAGTQRYAALCRALDTEPRFIKQPATFYGPDMHFLGDFTVPPPRAVGGTSMPDGSARGRRSSWIRGMTGNSNNGDHHGQRADDDYLDVPARQVS